MRPLTVGCGIVLLGVLVFGGVIAFSIWQGLKQSEAIDKFTQSERVLQPVEKLPPEQAAALDAALGRFTAALDKPREETLALDAAQLNHLLAGYEALADLRGQLAVRAITPEGIVASICYPINPLPFEKRSRFLVGEITLRPELAAGSAVLKVTALRVPGKEVPKWFFDQVAPHHLPE